LPGQYFDTETGLAYNYFRDYDASTGRYVESDPIGLRGGYNSFAYVRGNPLGSIDPFGLVDLNRFPAAENIHGYANGVSSPPGTYTVGAHGSPSSLINAAGQLMTPEQLADQINADPAANGKTVQLMSCNTGSGPEPYGQRLANRLGRNVIAPSNFVWYYASGNIVVAPGVGNDLNNGPDLQNPGIWVTFPPAGAH
jgi:RHS repeat-associated protein